MRKPPYFLAGAHFLAFSPANLPSEGTDYRPLEGHPAEDR